MNPEIEGRGGGFGKFQGLKLAEIQVLFAKCIEEPSMRSISAVLRITREQLDARGQLGIYPLFTWVAATVCVISVGLRFLGPPGLNELATKAIIGAGIVTLLLLASTIPSRNTRRTNVEQEKLIREMAVKALVGILEQKPAIKPLTMEQETTVNILIKKTENSEALRTLL